MAYKFTTNGDISNHGSASTLDDLHTATWMIIVCPTVFQNGNRIVLKSNGTNTTHSIYNNGTSGDFNVAVLGNATHLSAITNDAPMVVDKWTTMATRFSYLTDIPIVYANWVGKPLRVRTLSSSALGTGTPGSDAGGDLAVGSNNSSAQRWEGAIGFVAAWNRMLSFSEILEMQPWAEFLAGLGPRPITPFAIPNGNVLFCPFGGQDKKVIDYSPYGNHGVITGATPYPPLPVPMSRIFVPPYPSLMV
jgi:hypothetical protein